MPRYPFLILVLLALGCVPIQAQKKSAAGEPAKAPAEKSAAQLEAERVLKERRANAQSLLLNLAADARNFADATLRARIQARIADTLWELDRERSKAMFRSAWDAAEVADAESEARMQEDIRQQQARTGRGSYVLATPPNLRCEVLEAVVKRDQKLGEEFLAKYKEQKSREIDDRSRRSNPDDVDEATAQRFSLANDLLNAGDVDKAIQLVDAALGSVNMQSVDFLTSLRDKLPAAADQRYAAMLQTASMNPQADANTVSVLASYIFTPHSYVTFRGTGTSTASTGSGAPPNISAELRGAFFRTATAILLRPVPEQSTAGPNGQYLGLKRLMPLLEQFGSAEVTTALRSQLDSLGALASNEARNRDDGSMHPEKPPADRPPPLDREQSLLDRVDHAQTSAERDQIYLALAMNMVDKDDRRARDYVDKIEEMELRDGARAYIDAAIAWKVISKKDIDRALELARNGALTHLQKSWLLSQTADFIGVKDHERAGQVLEDAAAE